MQVQNKTLARTTGSWKAQTTNKQEWLISELLKDIPLKRRPMIYVAGPMTTGTQGPYIPIGIAARKAKELYNAGWLPFVPQLNSSWEMMAGELVDGRGTEGWLDYDFQIIERCDALFRMEGDSKGADREVALCKKLSIPVFAEGTMLANAAMSPPVDKQALVTSQRLKQYGKPQ